MSVELFIEKWSAPVGGYLYPWSIWKDGKQIHYGQRLKTKPLPRGSDEAFGLRFCATVNESSE